MRLLPFLHEFSRLISLGDPTRRAEWLASFLERHGFSYGARSADNILLLQPRFSVATLHRILAGALRTPLPDMALNAFERLAGVIPAGDLTAIACRRRSLSRFVLLCGSSPFLVNLIYRTPSLFRWLFLENGIAVSRTPEEMLAALRSRMEEGLDYAGLLRLLRLFKRAEIVRIATRDLCGLADLEEVTSELSSLAGAALQVAYEVCRRCLVAEYGVPLMETENGPVEAEMTVLGMGKLGGNELNFSSDIDIIYFYESDRGKTSGVGSGSGQARGVVSLHTFFVKLGEMITKALSQVTEDGFVFRVDLGLRPEGKSGDMAASLRSAEIYYESWGQSWERTAMLKARPVAGSLELGERFLLMLHPFVYRKYLDYTLIEDMKNMKQKIDASLSRSMEAETNLKLGRGGIREIEFFIQALQLVYAGKNPRLRERNSLKALDRLLEANIIAAEDHGRLSRAYRFLRTVEHRIQVVQERQTHNLPTKDDEILALARRSGFLGVDGVSLFREELALHRGNVSAIYGKLFLSRDARLRREVSPEVLFMLDHKAGDVALVKDMLAERRFEDVERAYENLISLREGPIRGNLTERNRRLLEKILPLLLEELLGSPDPDMALTHLERFLSIVGRRAAYYALLAENRKAPKLLVSLFGMSEFLSKILINHPELLESMLSLSYASVEKSRVDMERELSELLGRCGDFEDQLDALRRYHNEEVLRIGLNDIHGRVKQTVTTGQLSLLGEACLTAAYGIAVEQLRRFGRPVYNAGGDEVEANLAVIGMGKLGGGELNYHSDLDIIFVFDHQGFTDGAKQISNHEYFAKLAQKIIAILSMQTREGYVYKIDTRLRPSGNAGPLVTSLDSFLDYHRQEAQVWERQALTKARVVLGEASLANHLHGVIEKTVYGSTLGEEGRAEIHRLRMRMEHELARESAGSYNIKTGRGGMVDVEFIAQYLQLRYGFRYPELRGTSTIEALTAVGQLGLVPVEFAETLVSGYRFLRKLENRLRIIHDHSVNDLSGSRSYMNRLARRLGYDQSLRNPGVALISDYEEITGRIRDCYDRVMGERVV
jgi:glutamate-ammonia-ligase adenylyltransferase